MKAKRAMTVRTDWHGTSDPWTGPLDLRLGSVVNTPATMATAPVGACTSMGDRGVAGSVVYGGPFNVYGLNTPPFLDDAADWIRAFMAKDIPLLGICQSAQQIARALGAEVGPLACGQHECGTCPISPTPEGRDFLRETRHMTQAHFHSFAIPKGAMHLAFSPISPNQAFRHGEKTAGFQFHPKCTIGGFRRWQAQPWPPMASPARRRRLNRMH